MYKKLILIAITICFLFIVPTACANENAVDLNKTGDTLSSNNQLALNDNDALSVSYGDVDTLKADGTGNTLADLKILMDNTVAGQTLTLDRDFEYASSDTKTGLDFKNAITINGNNHTIDGKDQARLFKANLKGIIFNNITFKNGKGDNGGAILVSASNVEIHDSIFIDNYATGSGGAIRTNTNTIAIKVYNCEFINNTAVKYGGAVSTGELSEFYNSVFYGNRLTATSSDGTGGAINVQGDKKIGKISNCRFENNFANNGGGALKCGGGAIENSNFTSNEVATSKDGGAIYNHQDQLTITGSLFDSNKGKDTNYNIYNNKGSLSISTTTFKTIKPTLDVDNEGRINTDIPVSGKFYIGVNNYPINIKITANDNEIKETTVTNGAYQDTISFSAEGVYTLGIDNDENVVTYNTNKYVMTEVSKKISIIDPNNINHTYTQLQQFIDNTTEGGILVLPYYFKYSPAIDGKNFTNGVIINKNITIVGNGNYISGEHKYRIFQIDAEGVKLSNITFVNGSTGDGGAILLSKNDVEIRDSTFIDNAATGAGGAIRSGSNGLSGKFYNCEFINNTAGGYGGGAISAGSNFEFYNCIFIGNNATSPTSGGKGRGGAIYVRGESAIKMMSNCTFEDNHATFGGGAIICGGGTIKDTNFTSNTAGGDGGAIYNEKNTLTITGSLFDSNEGNANNYNIYDKAKKISIQTTTFKTIQPTIVAPTDSSIYTGISITGTFDIGVNDYPIAITLNANDKRISGDVSVENGIYGTEVSFRKVGEYTLTINNENNVVTSNTNKYVISPTSVIINIEDNPYVDINHTYTDLQNRIDNTPEGGTLVLPYYFKYTSDIDGGYFPEGVIINKTMTIDGNGNNISGENLYRIFDITVKDVNLTNITFINGHDDEGGAIYVEPTADATISDCTFANNTVTVRGGAISCANSIDVFNSTFINNTATDKLSSTMNDGGAIFTKYSNIDLCRFYNNTVADHGAGLYSEGKSVVTNSVFDGNKMNTDSKYELLRLNRGGYAIYSTGNLTIEYSNFTNNFKDYYRYNYDGLHAYYGAVVFTNFTEISHSLFENNSACYGGAISSICYYDAPKDYTFNITDVTFNNNRGYDGGAIYVSTTTHDLKRYYVNDIFFTIDNSTFYNNSGRDYGSQGFTAAGGAICIVNNKGYGNITRTSFDKNHVYIHEHASGGAISFQNSRIYIDECNFTNNWANKGGAIEYLNSSSASSSYAVTTYAVVTNSNFINNTAKVNGGGAFYYTEDYLIIKNCNLTNNTAINSFGGAIRNTGHLYAYDCNFNNNNATEAGGAISMTKVYIMEIIMEINNCNFTLNNAVNSNNDGFGGAIYAKECHDIDISNSRFNENYADRGGAIYSSSNADLNIEDSNFTKNTAPYGGALYAYKDNKDVLNNVLFDSNNATKRGGAIYSHTLAQLNINCSNFTDNFANVYGGAIFAQNITDLDIDETDFTGNVVNERGGAIYLTGITNPVAIDDDYFNKNIAFMGSAIFVGTSVPLYVSDTVFGKNRANASSLDISVDEKISYYPSNVTVEIIFKGWDNIVNAIWNNNGNPTNVFVKNITYEVYVKGEHYNRTTTNSFINPQPVADEDAEVWMDVREDTQLINIVVYRDDSLTSSPLTMTRYPVVSANREYVIDEVGTLTDVYGNVTKKLQNLPAGKYVVEARHILDDYYTEISNKDTFEIIDALKINKTTDDVDVYVCENVTYKITINNTGDKDLDDVTVVDSVPDGFILLDYSKDWTITGQAGNNITFRYNGILGAMKDIALILTFNATKEGKYNNTIYVSTNETNHREVNSSNETTVKPLANLTVVKYHNIKGNATVGDLIKFTINITNSGPSNATKVNVSDILDSAFEIKEIGNESYVSYSDAHKIIWTIPQIDKGTTASVYVIVKALTNGTFNNTAVAKSIESNETNGTVEVSANYNVSLSINKTANVTVVGNSSLVKFTFEVTNSGSNNATDVTVKDMIPDGLEVVETADGWKLVDGVYVWKIDLLESKATSWIVVKTTRVENYTNMANVTCYENKTVVNDTADINVVPVVLKANKTANVTRVANNTLVKFTINVDVESLVNATNVTVTDTLPEGLTFVDASSSLENLKYVLDNDNRTITWTIDELSQSIELYVTVRTADTGNLTNNVTVNSNENKTDATGNSTVEVVDVTLTIDKTANVTRVGNNTLVEFTIVVNNTAVVDATDVYVRDGLPSGFDFVSSTEGYDDVYNCWIIDELPAGESVTLKIIGRSSQIGNWTNYAYTLCNENDTLLNDTFDVEVVPVILTVNKTANVTVVGPDGLVNFTIEVSNNGPANATDVTVKDIIPDGLEVVETADGWELVDGAYVWKIDILESKATSWIVVRTTQVGNYTNMATAKCKENDTAVNDTADVNVVLTNLTVVKTANASEVSVGDLVKYTIKITNDGLVDAYDINITDLLNEAFDVAEIGNQTYLIYSDAQRIVWNIPQLVAGDEAEVYVIVKISTNGTFTNTAVSNSPQSNESNGTANVTAKYNPDMTVNKTVNQTTANVNENVEYTIFVNNTGDCNLTNVKVHEKFANGVELVGYDEDNWSYDGGIFTYKNSIAVGDNAILKIIVKITESGVYTNTVTVTSDEAENKTSSSENTTVYIPTHVSVENVTTYPGMEITIGVNVTADDDNPFNGNVTITLPDGSNRTVEIINGTGNVTWTVPEDYVPGNYTDNAAFDGKDPYLPSNGTGIVEVLPFIPTETVVGNVTGYPGDEVTIPVNVTADDGIPFNGNVTITLPDGTSKTVEIVDGTGTTTWTIPNDYVPGNYTDDAAFEGRIPYLPSNGTGIVTVVQIPTQVSIENVTAYPGENVSIPITVTIEDGRPFTGNVAVVMPDNTTQIISVVNGTGIITWNVPSDYAPDKYPDSIRFPGTEQYAPSNGTGIIEVVKIPTHITVGNVTTFAGMEVTIPINVTADDGNPFTGNVTITLPDGTSKTVEIVNGTGTATWFVPYDYTPDKYPDTVRFAGDDKYLPSEGTGTITVIKIGVDIIVGNVKGKPGENVRIPIEVIPKDGSVFNGKVKVTLPDGTVKVVEIVNGHGSVDWTIPKDYNGTYDVLVSFDGDNHYYAAKGTGTVKVTPDNNNTQPDDNVTKDNVTKGNVPYKSRQIRDTRSTGNPILALIAVFTILGISVRRKNK